MNRRTTLAIAVGAALFASMSFAQAQQTKPGPYALPPYLQPIQQDRADVRQDSHDIRQDERDIAKDRSDLHQDDAAIARDRKALGAAESQRSSDYRKLRADGRSGNQTAVAQDRTALKQDSAIVRSDRQALEKAYAERRKDRRDLRRDERDLRAERRYDVERLHHDEHRVQIVHATTHMQTKSAQAHPASQRRDR
jgi:hypothetical protein